MKKKRTVLITGAGGNVGQAAVKQFLSDGYRVIAITSPGKSGQTSSDSIHFIELNLKDEEGAQKVVQHCISKFGSIDAALITAGGWAGGSVDSTRGTDMDKMISLNFTTAFNIVRPVFMQMKEQAFGGRIVLFGARAALVPQQGKTSFAYSLSKGMLFHLAELLNAEGADRNVVTSVVVPATIDTPQNREAMPKANFADWVTPDEIAKLMSFLCSADASALRDPVIKVYGAS